MKDFKDIGDHLTEEEKIAALKACNHVKNTWLKEKCYYTEEKWAEIIGVDLLEKEENILLVWSSVNIVRSNFRNKAGYAK